MRLGTVWIQENTGLLAFRRDPSSSEKRIHPYLDGVAIASFYVVQSERGIGAMNRAFSAVVSLVREIWGAAPG